jgi:hypothetical protein
MKFAIKKGSTSVILPVFIQDSSSTVGAGLSGLIETSSITGGYVKRNGLGVALTVDEDVTTEGTYQAPTTAAQVRIGTPANMPAGFYELHFHNDLFTTADWLTIGLEGATNMATLPLEIQLTDLDMNVAMRGTDGANTVVPDTAGTAPTAVEVRQEIDNNSTKTGYALTATGLDLILFDSIFLLASTKQNWSDTLTAYTNGMAGKRVKGLTSVFVVEGSVGIGSTTTTIETDLTGYPDNIFRDTDISIELAADQWQTQIVSSYNGTTGQFVVDEVFVSAPVNGDAVSLRLNHTHTLTEIKEQVRAEMDSNSTQLAVAVALFTTQLTESYAADGAAPTPAQSLLFIQQLLSDFAIVGVTLTARKVDGVTTAFTLTLNDATNPTGATRAT